MSHFSDLSSHRGSVLLEETPQPQITTVFLSQLVLYFIPCIMLDSEQVIPASAIKGEGWLFPLKQYGLNDVSKKNPPPFL